MDLEDGGTVEVRGSSNSVYELRNVGGAYSCSCPAWRNQGRAAHQRTCKHLRAFRGDAAEQQRLLASGVDEPPPPKIVPRATVASKEPGILLAHSWDQVSDLTGWWMSEKLDGVRAYWDGKQLYSRLGNAFVAPQWFRDSLPARPLDGELWSGRKRFQRTVSIVRRQDASPEWKHIRYVVFDAPEVVAPFEERLQTCRDWLTAGSEHCEVLEHSPCRGLEHLRQELARVEGEGGEGLMLRKPGSLYEAGRSWSLLKIKSFHDAEATVIGHQAGEGRHKGRVGALLVQLENGTRFSVGTGLSDRERENPPPVGTLITFRYQELSDAGVPRFPSYVGERIDARPMRIQATNTKPEVSMQVIQVGLTEACDLQSSNAHERLGLLLNGLRAYTTGNKEALKAYAEKHPYSRLNEVLEAGAAPAPKAAPPAPKPVASAAAVESGFQRYEFSDGTSNKFWEVAVDGSNQTVRYGRLGTAGQAKTKAFNSPAEARRDTDKLIAEKLAKGYEEA